MFFFFFFFFFGGGGGGIRGGVGLGGGGGGGQGGCEPRIEVFVKFQKKKIAKSVQSSHTPGGSHHRQYHFNWKERKIDK